MDWSMVIGAVVIFGVPCCIHLVFRRSGRILEKDYRRLKSRLLMSLISIQDQLNTINSAGALVFKGDRVKWQIRIQQDLEVWERIKYPPEGEEQMVSLIGNVARCILDAIQSDTINDSSLQSANEMMRRISVSLER